MPVGNQETRVKVRTPRIVVDLPYVRESQHNRTMNERVAY
jgi:hypothetical protein